MSEVEGLLSADPNSYELNSDADGVDDHRDFTNDQIIEGQFTVLCLGFDESRSNSDATACSLALTVLPANPSGLSHLIV